MNKAIKNVVIVGGGSAGWLTAGVIAAEHQSHLDEGVQVTLIESPDVNIIGVGEGTWPTLRETLHKIGISETDLFRECDASFKQGAKFAKWVTGAEDDFYYHPFVIPHGYLDTDLVFSWQKQNNGKSFADTVSFQGHLCQQNLAPKQITTPEYAAVANYAYHLNAVKLGQFLRKHCVEKLGVKHIVDHVTAVNTDENEYIASLTTKQQGNIAGDLFIDCTGLHALLIGKHYQIPFISKKDILFNDSALAAQVPYINGDDEVIPYTISTAQNAGWIWDIGLPNRRGVGYAYSSKYSNDADAEVELKNYIAQSIGNEQAQQLMVKKIDINPGHRAEFWHKNCVAIGMASGFLEPLEASALVMIELAAEKISRELPASRAAMKMVAKRYNKQFLYRWDRIIDFLKLHYVLTKRTDTAYWRDNCNNDTIPESLQELLTFWQYHPPSQDDLERADEVFPSSSWQYILYGMGFKTKPRATAKKSVDEQVAQAYFAESAALTEKFLNGLPKNRALIEKIIEFGLQKV